MPEQQLVEIAKALGGNVKVLILDEPTASLTERETDRLFDIIQRLRAGGAGIVYISHRLEELGRIADRITVLRDGETIETRAAPRAPMSRTLIRLMAGRDLSAVFPKRAVPIGEPVLDVSGLTSPRPRIGDISFEVRAGEIFGIAGLVGAGRTQLAETLFGLTPADSGTIRVDGRGRRDPQARRRHPRGHRLCARRPPAPRRGGRTARSRQHHAGDPEPHRARHAAADRRESAARRDLGLAPGRQDRWHRRAGLLALGRQSAEGRHRAAGSPPSRRF